LFGYIRPYKPLLLMKDFQMYKDIYCSLCKRLGKDYGFLARFTLSYDCTFFSMIKMGLDGVCPQFKKGRCVVNPLKRCSYCVGGQDALQMASALSVISVYYKIQDDIQDSGLFKKILCYLIKPFAGHWRKKAMKSFPQIENIVKNMTQQQWQIEKHKNSSIDVCAEPTAIMLRDLMVLLAKGESEKLVFSQFGYFLGKWVYLIDAADDYNEDKINGGFNPFVNRFADMEILEKDRLLYINGVLNDIVSHILSAYNLMDIRICNDILNNTLKDGIGQMQKSVIFDKNKNKSKSKEKF